MTRPTIVTEEPLKLEWRDGAPGNPWAGEWFIALTTYGDRVVLKALPEEYAYDFKTADETYIMRDKIAKWMQFPDSEYIAPATIVTDEVVERLRNALEPFAKAADIKLCGEWADDKHFSQTDVGFALTFGDLREARAAIAAMPAIVGGE